MKKSKKLLSLLLVFVMALALCGGALADETAAPTGEMAGQIVILHSNDVHGAISGYAKLAALKAEYEAKGAYVLTMDAGDYFQGTPYVSVSKGAAAVELMNLAGYDVSTLGNHEFDYGYENLTTVLKNAEYKVVAANIKYNGTAAFDANTVFTAPDGTKIGVFGLDTPETATKANPAMIKGVTFTGGKDMYAIAQAQVDALKAQGCDLIVCLGHLGVDDESVGNRSTDLLAAVTGIDLFIDGHSHTVIDGNDNDYETGDAMLVSTGTAFAYIGVVIDNGGKLTSKLVPVTDDMAADETVKAKADAITKEIDDAYGDVFAVSDVRLNGDRAPGNRTEGTNLGDLITDAIVWETEQQGVDVDAALTNGGGIRATIEAGDVTMKDINTVLPFGNTIAIVQVTGAELLEALEASTYSTPTAIGGFPQVAGITFTIDTTKDYDAGDHYPGSTYKAPASINRVTIESVGGKAFSLTAEYTIATNNFTAAGGDTYYVFANSPFNYDLGIPLDEAVMDYVKTALNGKITAADYGEPDGEITVLPCVSDLFTDVSRDSWARPYIQTAYDKGIMTGTSAATFEPDTAMTRAMLVTMLYRMENSPEVTGKVSGVFTDCADDAWYADAVLWASQSKIVTGITDTTFEPLTKLTRQQMATILYRYAVYNGAAEQTDLALAFTDAGTVAAWAAPGVAYCAGKGIMTGVTEATFVPDGTASRAMGATVMSRIAA